MAKYLYSPVKQKIILLLASGLMLGFSSSPRTHMRIWKNLPKALKGIDRAVLRRMMDEFKYKRLVDFRHEKDGYVTIILTELGQKHALRYNPDNVSIRPPSRWDHRWRVVVFDIPEKKKHARETFRRELKRLGFFELQKSTWVIPYDCKNVIDFFVELFEIRQCVRLLEVSHMSHDADLRLHFAL